MKFQEMNEIFRKRKTDRAHLVFRKLEGKIEASMYFIYSEDEFVLNIEDIDEVELIKYLTKMRKKYRFTADCFYLFKEK
jgi:hypothetical protein